eukprot:1830297-Rhodomonas_salina.1
MPTTPPRGRTQRSPSSQDREHKRQQDSDKDEASSEASEHDVRHRSRSRSRQRDTAPAATDAAMVVDAPATPLADAPVAPPAGVFNPAATAF